MQKKLIWEGLYNWFCSYFQSRVQVDEVSSLCLSDGSLSLEHIRINCIIYTPWYASKSKMSSITEIKEQSTDMIHHTSKTQ